MKKPLELTWHDKHPHADAYRIGGAMTPYAIVAVDKALTEAELMAECFRQLTRACAESGMNHSRPNSYDIDVIPGDALTFGPARAETSRLGALKRFAELPHAATSDYQ